LENIAIILSSIMADRTPGQELTWDKLEACAVPEDEAEFENDYDLRGVSTTKYEHTTYQADPYYGTVGWYKFIKGKGKKTVAATNGDEGAYECLVLKKITKSVKNDGTVDFNEFAINLPVSIIPMAHIVFHKIMKLRDEYSASAREAFEAVN
jgi:hypothetical protein